MPARSTPVSVCSVARACGPWIAISAYRELRVHGHGVADAGDLLPDPREVLVGVRGVDDHQEMVVGHLVDQQVVHERALRRHQARVVDLPDLEPRRVVARDPLHGGQGIRTRDLDLTHVADVEHPSPRAHRQVLCGDAGVLDGHLPSSKRHQPALCGEVLRVERRAFQGDRRRGLRHTGRYRRQVAEENDEERPPNRSNVLPHGRPGQGRERVARGRAPEVSLQGVIADPEHPARLALVVPAPLHDQPHVV